MGFEYDFEASDRALERGIAKIRAVENDWEASEAPCNQSDVSGKSEMAIGGRTRTHV